MTTIDVVSGWNPGSTKVQFTFLLQRELGYRLRGAKLATDAVSECRLVESSVEENVERLLEARRDPGARFAAVVPVA